LHIQWFTNFSRTNIPSFMTHKDLENDLEVQYDLRTKHHKLTTGGNVRWVHIQDQSQIGQVQVEDSPFNEYWAGLFVIDRWQVTDRFTLEGQFRGDYYSGTRSDWSARVSGLYALDKAKRHILRVSGAKAFRTPLVGLRRGSLSQVRLPLPTPPFPPNLYAFNLLRSRGELENEETASVELGYTGQFTKHLAFRANGYFQRYDKLIDYLPLEGDPLGFGRAFYQVKRTGGANAWGAELELELKGKPGKLSAWYAYNALRLDHQGFYEQNMRMDYLPARHKVGITGRLNLPWGMVFNTNYRFTSATNSLYDIAGLAISHHLDLTLTKKVEIGKAEGEFMIGVNDLFRYRREPAYSMGDVVEHDTPGRTFFARFQVKF